MPFFDSPTLLVIILVLVVIIGGLAILLGTGSTDPGWSERNRPDRD